MSKIDLIKTYIAALREGLETFGAAEMEWKMGFVSALRMVEKFIQNLEENNG